jgi:predicted nucleic acid-binding protein
VRYVLDCSVALKWVVPEEGSDTAERVLTLYESGDVSFAAPDTLIAELGHSLRRFVLNRKLPADEAASGLDELLGMRIDLIPSAALAPQALQLALAHMGTFYDALYVSLAVREDLKVLTADRRMAAAFDQLERILLLADFPVG